MTAPGVSPVFACWAARAGDKTPYVAWVPVGRCPQSRLSSDLTLDARTGRGDMQRAVCLSLCHICTGEAGFCLGDTIMKKRLVY